MDRVGVVPAVEGASTGGGEDADAEELDVIQDDRHPEGLEAERVLVRCGAQLSHALQRHPQPPRRRNPHVRVQHHRVLCAPPVTLRARHQKYQAMLL